MNESIAVIPSGLAVKESDTATRFLKLPHPRTGAPALYLPASKLESAGGANVDILLEVQAINATGDKQRSWFTGDDKVIGDGKLLLLTPFDPVFLLVRILLVVGQNAQSHKSGTTRVSLPYEDIFESAAEHLRFPSTSTSSNGTATVPETPRSRSRRQKQQEEELNTKNSSNHASADDEAAAALLFEDMRRFGELPLTKAAMSRICQVQAISLDLSTYKLDDEKLKPLLRGKVERLSQTENFSSSPTLMRILAKEGIVDSEGNAAELHAEARQKSALDILSGYLPKEISTVLRASYSFPHYDAYQSRFGLQSHPSSGSLSTSTPSLTSGSSSASFSSLDSEAVSTFGMPKKRSGDGQEGLDPKKKKIMSKESNGVRALKKVSKKGMTPLTSFFTKKTPTPSPSEETPPPAVSS